MFRLVFHLILIVNIMLVVKGDTSRTLMYTNGGVFKLVLGWAVPLEVPMSVIFAHNLQFQYPPIDNATKLSELVQHGLARSMSLTRKDMYEHMEELLWRIGDGFEDCLLKLICQVSEAPISHNGLFAEIIQLLFTPNLNRLDKYSEAWWSGQSGQDCDEIYSCPKGSGLLDKFSIIRNE